MAADFSSRYEIRVGRSKSVSGPFVDKANKSLLHGGGSTILASHAQVFAPGGPGVLKGGDYQSQILYYHYCELLFVLLKCRAN